MDPLRDKKVHPGYRACLRRFKKIRSRLFEPLEASTMFQGGLLLRRFSEYEKVRIFFKSPPWTLGLPPAVQHIPKARLIFFKSPPWTLCLPPAVQKIPKKYYSSYLSYLFSRIRDPVGEWARTEAQMAQPVRLP